jgi:hypothetical protein
MNHFSFINNFSNWSKIGCFCNRLHEVVHPSPFLHSHGVKFVCEIQHLSCIVTFEQVLQHLPYFCWLQKIFRNWDQIILDSYDQDS